jgi:hypothetical protein
MGFRKKILSSVVCLTSGIPWENLLVSGDIDIRTYGLKISGFVLIGSCDFLCISEMEGSIFNFTLPVGFYDNLIIPIPSLSQIPDAKFIVRNGSFGVRSLLVCFNVNGLYA